jgi:hypothetical protein
MTRVCLGTVGALRGGLLILLVGVWLTGGAAGQMQIAAGIATVDGDLSDWAGANWIAMNAVFYADPPELAFDLTGAKWAAKWTPDTIYVAVTGVDTDHVFTATNQGWDQQDSVEVYVDAANQNYVGYADPGSWSQAQQYCGAPTPTAGEEWLNMGWVDVPEGTLPGFETTVVGDTINYEFALRPYNNYNINDVAASTAVTLSGGMTIGLDVVIDTRQATWGTGFGMLCWQNGPDKWNDASVFLDQVLAGSVLPGDANLDGVVDAADASIVGSNWQLQSGAIWAMGDFNGDQKVNDQDAAIMAAHWSTGAEGSVPEPGAVVLLISAAIVLWFRRRL